MGKTDIIISFDWLHKHNPMVDWHTGHIVFNRCPTSCNPLNGQELEEELQECTNRVKNIRVEEGDCIFATPMLWMANSCRPHPANPMPLCPIFLPPKAFGPPVCIV